MSFTPTVNPHIKRPTESFSHLSSFQAFSSLNLYVDWHLHFYHNDLQNISPFNHPRGYNQWGDGSWVPASINQWGDGRGRTCTAFSVTNRTEFADARWWAEQCGCNNWIKWISKCILRCSSTRRVRSGQHVSRGILAAYYQPLRCLITVINLLPT